METGLGPETASLRSNTYPYAPMPFPFMPQSGQPYIWPRVKSVIDQYMQHNRCCRTLKHTKHQRLEAFTAFLDGKPLEQCRAIDLIDFINAHAAAWGPWTKRQTCLMINAAFNWAVKVQLIPANPFRTVSYPPGPDRRDVTEEEFKALVEACSPQHQNFLKLLWFTGARPCELRRLEWRHLNIDNDPPLIVLGEGEHKTWNSTHKPRIIRLTPQALEVIADQDRLQGRRGLDSAFVFCRRDGQPYGKTGSEHAFRRAREKAGLPEDVLMYGIRHAMGTRLAAQGFGAHLISEALGHARSATSDRYVHLHGRHKDVVMAMRLASGDTVRRLPT